MKQADLRLIVSRLTAFVEDPEVTESEIGSEDWSDVDTFALCFSLSKISAEAQMSQAFEEAGSKSDSLFDYFLQGIMRTVEIGLSATVDETSGVALEMRKPAPNNKFSKNLKDMIRSKTTSVLAHIECLQELMLKV